MSREESHLEAFEAARAQFLGELRQELASTKLGVVVRGAEVRQVRTGQSGGVSFSSGRLLGWSFRETTGTTPATVYLRDGRDANADIVIALQLAAGESTRDSYFPGGLSFQWGLYLDVAAGSVEGAVFVNGSAD